MSVFILIVFKPSPLRADICCLASGAEVGCGSLLRCIPDLFSLLKPKSVCLLILVCPCDTSSAVSLSSPQTQRHVTDLYEDLRDGHNLISLLEVLSGETLVSSAWRPHSICLHSMGLSSTSFCHLSRSQPSSWFIVKEILILNWPEIQSWWEQIGKHPSQK